MIAKQTKVTGVILAGGQARRMNYQDKGLVLYKSAPLINYAIAAMSPLVDELVINANRNQDEYRRFGLPVIADKTASFEGPLAGILAAISYATAEVLLAIPCDSPLIKTVHLQKLVTTLLATDKEIAVAFDGECLHPVFLALKTHLKNSLETYLQSGERKVSRWIEQHNFVKVDFSDTPEVFLNLNTLEELENLEKSTE
jgi:molybdopterin-guanine dinucleotide biosynthesis protein A